MSSRATILPCAWSVSGALVPRSLSLSLARALSRPRPRPPPPYSSCQWGSLSTIKTQTTLCLFLGTTPSTQYWKQTGRRRRHYVCHIHIEYTYHIMSLSTFDAPASSSVSTCSQGDGDSRCDHKAVSAGSHPTVTYIWECRNLRHRACARKCARVSTTQQEIDYFPIPIHPTSRGMLVEYLSKSPSPEHRERQLHRLAGPVAQFTIANRERQ